MNQPDTLLNIAEILPSDQNLSISERQEIEERELRIEELVSEPNSDVVDYTGFQHRNGSTDAISVDTGRFLFSIPPQPNGHERFQAIQKWEGQVISVGKETFSVQLIPLVGEGAPQQETEIYLEDVDSSDRFLIKPGAVFYWSIGYLDRPSGRVRASILRFRRLPTWSEQELKQAELRTSRLEGLLNVE
jgi:hypothetical protein